MSTHNPTSVAEIELSDLPTDLERIGSGGEGNVYRLGVTDFSSRPCAFKKYKAQASVDEQHLEKLVKFITKLGEVAPERRDWLLDHAAWPTHLVRDDGELVGIIMPLIPERFFRTLGSSKSAKKRTAELQFLLNRQDFMQRIGLRVSERQRYEFLLDFADLLRILHGAQIRVGDISVKNILFCHDSPGPHAYLIDCDSMSIGASEGPAVQTPRWEVPNNEKPQTVASDSYKFGLLVLRMLASDQETRAVSNLPSDTPAEIRTLTERALTAAPGSRPVPKEWLGALEQAAQNASTQVNAASASSGSVSESADETDSHPDELDGSVVTKTISRRTEDGIPTAVSLTPSTSDSDDTAVAAVSGTAPASTASTTNSASPTKKQTRHKAPGTWAIIMLTLTIAGFATGRIPGAIISLVFFLMNLYWFIEEDDE